MSTILIFFLIFYLWKAFREIINICSKIAPHILELYEFYLKTNISPIQKKHEN